MGIAAIPETLDQLSDSGTVSRVTLKSPLVQWPIVPLCPLRAESLLSQPFEGYFDYNDRRFLAQLTHPTPRAPSIKAPGTGTAAGSPKVKLSMTN